MSEVALDLGFIPARFAEAPTVEMPAVRDENRVENQMPVITPNHFIGVGDYALKYLDTHVAADADSHYSTEQSAMMPDYAAYEQRYIAKHVKERMPARHALVRTNLAVSALARFGLLGVDSQARHR